MASGWPFKDIIDQVGETARQVLPNKIEEKRLELQGEEIAQRGDLAQIDVNKTEATHSNLFVAGWRPFIGWTGGVALAYTWILSPLIKAIWGLEELPALSPDEIYPVILGILGLGAMRTVEKYRGVATSVGGRVMVPRRPVPADIEDLV